jgi:muramidase (phage lysozyme)
MSDIEERPATVKSTDAVASNQSSEAAAPSSPPAEPTDNADTPPSRDFDDVEPDSSETDIDKTDDESAPREATQPVPAQVDDSPQTDQAVRAVTLRLRMVDFAGIGIVGLPVRIEVNNIGRSCATNALGYCPQQEDLIPGSSLEILVQKESSEWVSKYAGTVLFGDMDICGVSPSIKIPIRTEPHAGTPVAAKPTVLPVAPAKPPQPNAPPKGTPMSGGSLPTCITTQAKRDEQGHPIARVREQLVDWAGRVGIPTFGLWRWDDFRSTSPTRPLECAAAPNTDQGGPASPTVTAPSSSGAQFTKNPAANAASTPPAQPPAQPRAAALVGLDLKVSGLDQPAPSEVVHLLDIMEEQVAWDWKSAPLAATAADIINQITTKTLGTPGLKSPTSSHGRCYKSVKVGLKRANYVAAVNGDIPAMTAGPWLLDQGFRNVTDQLPDARWALPGDVIIYKYPTKREAENDAKSQTALNKALEKFEKEKAAYTETKRIYDQSKSDFESTKDHWLKENPKKSYPKKFTEKPPPAPKAPVFETQNYGHIDVRSYDSYLSDFKPASNSLPDANKFAPIAIYRKVSDPLPVIRLRAFLKVLRGWECHEESDDDKRYFMLNSPINGSRRFSDTTKHPFDGIESKVTPAGAYQITRSTYNLLQAPRFGIPVGFTKTLQDRLAVCLIEQQPGNPLGLIRRGDIAKAVTILKSTWACLPGTDQTRHEPRNGKNYIYTMDDFLAAHMAFMREQIK